jgi:hypothetical protein
MAVKVTEVFMNHPELFDEKMRERMSRNNSPFSFKGLVKVQSTAESKAINNIKGTIMVIAGSGMCTGGRIKHHLANNISRPKARSFLSVIRPTAPRQANFDGTRGSYWDKCIRSGKKLLRFTALAVMPTGKNCSNGYKT